MPPRTVLLLATFVVGTSGLLNANPEGSPQTLAGICDKSPYSQREPCDIKVDVPTACARDASCPIVFFFHGMGGKNTLWTTNNMVPSVLHDGKHNFVAIYPQVRANPRFA